MKSYEVFYDEVKEASGVLRITIPDKLARFINLKKGDSVKCLITKEDNKND